MTVLWSCSNLHQTRKARRESVFSTDHTGLRIAQAINQTRSKMSAKAPPRLFSYPVQPAARFTHTSAACLPSLTDRQLGARARRVQLPGFCADRNGCVGAGWGLDEAGELLQQTGTTTCSFWELHLSKDSQL